MDEPIYMALRDRSLQSVRRRACMCDAGECAIIVLCFAKTCNVQLANILI